jgi:hypothetical protein
LHIEGEVMLKTAIRIILLGIVLSVINIGAESYGVTFPNATSQVVYDVIIVVAAGLIMMTGER